MSIRSRKHDGQAPERIVTWVLGVRYRAGGLVTLMLWLLTAGMAALVVAEYVRERM